MPQAPTHLSEKFDSDEDAHDLLRSRGFKKDIYLIYHPPTLNHVCKQDERDALDYLVLEWDYAYDGRPLETDSSGKDQQAELEFRRGYYLATANIMRTHDQSVIAEDVLKAYGPVDFKGIDPMEIKILEPIAEELSRKAKL